MAPIKEYLLLLAQPAIKILITIMDETALTYNTPMFRFHNWKSFAKAIGAINNIATTNAITGARLNKNLSAPPGVNPSFTNSFKVSANDCNIPLGPTLLGPSR